MAVIRKRSARKPPALLLGVSGLFVMSVATGAAALFAFGPLSIFVRALAWGILLLPVIPAMMLYSRRWRGSRALLLRAMLPFGILSASLSAALWFNGLADASPVTTHAAAIVETRQQSTWYGLRSWAVFTFRRSDSPCRATLRVPHDWIKAGYETRAFEIRIAPGALGIPWVHGVEEVHDGRSRS